MKLENKFNFFLFTGGPGAGKTTVLEELARLGYLVAPEVAREIIKNQHATGGNATHVGDRNTYSDLMFKQSLKDFQDRLSIKQIIFFDRGLPDLYSYMNRFCGEVKAEIIAAIAHYRYNPKVFLFPPWPEIYCHDTERKQDFQEAIETYVAVKEGYATCGYQMIEVPKSSIEKRVLFILKTLSN
ncbi:MAG: AAA family ATPase [Tatlockia sp.]|nr:AAA family ATPase [Tatlockia sp.]